MLSTISVRDLVGLVMRSGDIDNRFQGGQRMKEGQEVHKAAQSDYPDGWEKEVFFKLPLEAEGILVQGRADGVFHRRGIHEIKSTRRKLLEWDKEGEPEHWAQAYCYAYMLALSESLTEVAVRLTYINVQAEQKVDFDRTLSFDALEVYFKDLIEQYRVWHELKQTWLNKRQESLKAMGFPFGTYRNGQRKLAAAVYSAVRDGFPMMAEAPTGVGKTVSTLFPTLKAMGEAHVDRIFYLTAKTVARTVAEDALRHMRRQGAAIKSLTLTAKEKVCLTGEKKCNPVDCRYARGHYDRVNGAMLDALVNEDHMDREAIVAYSEKHSVCPAEFALDMSLFSDVIIGDYNYAFDPLSRLQRFFVEVTERYAFLVDEAHNLPNRARDMYSTAVSRQEVLTLRKAYPKKSEAYKALGKLNTQLLDIEKGLKVEDEAFRYQSDLNGKLLATLSKAFEAASLHQVDHEGFELSAEDTERLLSCFRFVFLSDYYGEGHYWLETQSGCQMLCMDPSYALKAMYESAKSVVLFSATMAPYDYYESVLGVEGVRKLVLESPFAHHHRKMLLGSGVDTRKKGREKSYGKIVTYIEGLVKAKAANYLVFCPSYEFLSNIEDGLRQAIERGKLEANLVTQHQGMSEQEKLNFLEAFESVKPQATVGLAVLGGSFSEGIDLVGEMLEGVVLVGFGTPYMSWENELLKTFYESHQKNGYEYAYVYPAINKIVQAVGRLIRTETDRGVVLFLEDRYLQARYRLLLPNHWRIEKYQNPEDIYEVSQQFWQE